MKNFRLIGIVVLILAAAAIAYWVYLGSQETTRYEVVGVNIVEVQNGQSRERYFLPLQIRKLGTDRKELSDPELVQVQSVSQVLNRLKEAENGTMDVFADCAAGINECLDLNCDGVGDMCFHCDPESEQCFEFSGGIVTVVIESNIHELDELLRREGKKVLLDSKVTASLEKRLGLHVKVWP